MARRRGFKTAVQQLFTAIAVVLCAPQGGARGVPPSLPPGAPQRFTFSHPAMGTVYQLFLYSPTAADAGTVADEVFEEIDRLDQALSNYKPDSELSRINNLAAQAPVTTDPEVMRFLLDARQWSEASDGAFDITVGKLMKAWGFYRHQGHIPPVTEMARLRDETGWKKLELDADRRTVRFASAGVELDPGGIGKGFAVDAAVKLLRAEGVKAAMISAGGSTVYALGAPPGKAGWPVTLEGPLPSHATLSTVELRDMSLSSADCSQKNFVENRHLYCHIMDPHTLRPVEGRVQVTIVDPSATASDALSNVLFVETPQRSFEVLRRRAPAARALVISQTGGEVQCALFRWTSPVALPQCKSE